MVGGDRIAAEGRYSFRRFRQILGTHVGTGCARNQWRARRDSNPASEAVIDKAC